LTVSEQKSEQTNAESGSIDAGSAVPASSAAQSEPVTASAQAPLSVESPDLAPKSEAGETPNTDAAKAEAPKVEAEAPKETSKPDAKHIPGKVMIMSSGDRSWDGHGVGPESQPEPNSGMFGKRRLSALAAVVALAAVTGALCGALATAGLGHVTGDDNQTTASRALEEQVARLDADLAALKAGIEHTSKLGMTQFNKTSDRLDKVEKAQIEPAAKLAKLSDAVDKLRAASPVAATPVAAAAPVAAKEVTGSIAPPATAAAATPAAAPKAEVARLPTLDGWVLRDVGNGGALIEGRRGMFEVYAGDPIPGLGRVDAIRRQDGRWVVVTSKGLIVAR
jgi:hypothetical protein